MVTDEVRDLMVMTVPSLEEDGSEALVEPDEMMADDGLDAEFAKAFALDEVKIVEAEVPKTVIVEETLDVQQVPVSEMPKVVFSFGTSGRNVCLSF